MARLGRYEVAGVPQHVIQRGNNRQAVFFADEGLRPLPGLARRGGGGERLCGAGRSGGVMSATSTMRIAARAPCGRAGTRRRSSRASATYSPASVIELNPVRAGLAAEPGGFPWSSYGRNGQGRRDPLVTVARRSG